MKSKNFGKFRGPMKQELKAAFGNNRTVEVKAWALINSKMNRPFAKVSDSQLAIFLNRKAAREFGYGIPVPCTITYFEKK